MGLIWGFISGDDFIHAERKYTRKCPQTSAFPLQIGKPCKTDDYNVYVVMAAQSKKVKLCPYVASRLVPFTFTQLT